MSYETNNDYLLPALDPFEVFDQWYKEVSAKKVDDPTVMTLATVNKAGRPKARTLLLKKYTNKTFTFFTNYDSHKGSEISQNPFGAVTFFWQGSDYQVRIEGKIQKSPKKVSDAYFSTRAKESQLASIASSQSQPIASRQALLDKLAKISEKHSKEEIKRPSNWGGYDLIPDRFIFFIYGKHRINDRFEFSLEDSTWKIRRLQP